MNRTAKTAIVGAAILMAMTEPATAQAPVLIGFVDTGTRLAVRRAVQGASARLRRPACQDVLSDFRDESGQPLVTRLAASGRTVAEAFSFLRFYDDRGAPKCRAGTTLAFTQTGFLIIHVCGGVFKETVSQNSTAAEFSVIHEFLHTLGLGENPPTSEAITAQVARRCGG